MKAPGTSAVELTSVGSESVHRSAARNVLEQIRGSPLLAEGRINLICLGAIAERLGQRWPARRDFVYDHTERVLGSKFGPHALVQRISDTEYLVGSAAGRPGAAQLSCLSCLRDILQRFLGSAPLDAIRVHRITRVTDDGLFGQRVGIDDIDAVEPPPPAPQPPSSEVKRSLDRWTPFASADGRKVTVSASLEPLVALKNVKRIGYRVASRVQHLPGRQPLTRKDYEGLASGDIQKIDFGTVARGLDRLISATEHQKPPTLILPVSFVTLQSLSGRATFTTLLKKARSFVSIGIIVEISGLEGAPPAGVHAAVAGIRPFSLYAIGRVTDMRRGDVRHLIGAGLKGVSARCPQFCDEPAFRAGVHAFAAANRSVAQSLLLHQVENVHRARMARECGVSHVTLAPKRVNLFQLDDEPR